MDPFAFTTAFEIPRHPSQYPHDKDAGRLTVGLLEMAVSQSLLIALPR
jgi:hypothetical protein